MDDLERKFISLIKGLTGGRYLVVVAILQAMIGADTLEPVEGYTRGDFKRVIRSLRESAVMAPQFSEDFDRAVMMVRRDWLHREGAAG